MSSETQAELKTREELLQAKDQSEANKLAFTEQRRKVHKMIRRDERDFITRDVENAIERGTSLRHVKNGIFDKKSWIQRLTDETGRDRHHRSEVIEIATNFYEKLYSSQISDAEPLQNNVDLSGKDEVEDISEEEVRWAASKMKNNKATGSDDIPVDLLKVCNNIGIGYVVLMFNMILQSEKVPTQRLESIIILIFKPGAKNEISNYRPINLIAHLCKLFMKILMIRMEKDLERHQPPEQAGFRSNFSTTDHIFTVNQLIEKCSEFNKKIYICFVDYQKAFDSLEHV